MNAPSTLILSASPSGGIHRPVTFGFSSLRQAPLSANTFCFPLPSDNGSCCRTWNSASKYLVRKMTELEIQIFSPAFRVSTITTLDQKRLDPLLPATPPSPSSPFSTHEHVNKILRHGSNSPVAAHITHICCSCFEPLGHPIPSASIHPFDSSMIRPMFPAARCFFVPLHPQPHATIPFRRAPAATTVSAKPRRWTRGPRRDRSWDDDGGGSDSDADDGFFGQEPDDGDDEPEREEPTPGRSASPFAAPAGGQLRGSDVLRALQRAAAAKEAARRKKDKRPAAPRRSREKPVGGGVEEAGEVRPVLIRPEWAARIRELEGRVEQLADKYHHHQ